MAPHVGKAGCRHTRHPGWKYVNDTMMGSCSVGGRVAVAALCAFTVAIVVVFGIVTRTLKTACGRPRIQQKKRGCPDTGYR